MTDQERLACAQGWLDFWMRIRHSDVDDALAALLARVERATQVEALTFVLKIWREGGTVRTIDDIESELARLARLQRSQDAGA